MEWRREYNLIQNTRKMVNGSITADTKWNDTLMENTQRKEHGDTTGSIIYKRKKQYKMQHNIPRMGTYNKCRGPIPNFNGDS